METLFILLALCSTMTPQYIASHPEFDSSPLDKMAAFSHTIFSDAFSWIKGFVFWIKFHLSFFLRVLIKNKTALVQIMAPNRWQVIIWTNVDQGAVSIRKTVLPGMAIPMLKIRRPNGRLIFNMEITIRRWDGLYIETGPWFTDACMWY